MLVRLKVGRANLQPNKLSSVLNLDLGAFFLQGALLLTEVLQERDAQIELKKQKEAAYDGKDTELLKQYRCA